MAKEDPVILDNLYLFWRSPLGQWHKVNFKAASYVYENSLGPNKSHHGDKELLTYNCCEQYMMAEKARLFGDNERLKLIMEAQTGRVQKDLGRKVENFDEGVWNKHCQEIVFRGNLARFSQSENCKKRLLDTNKRVIAEASPIDQLWGIGRAPDDKLAHDIKTWNGKNWLGLALMRVRKTITG